MHDVRVRSELCVTESIRDLHTAFKFYLMAASMVLLVDHFLYHDFFKREFSFTLPYSLNLAWLLNRYEVKSQGYLCYMQID